MLGLLAFVLAFSFGSTASRLDARKQLLLDEVNAIGTAVLRADLLPEPYRTECRELLTKYVNIRANPNVTKPELPGLIAESEAILDQLWARTTALAAAEMDAPIRALFVQSLNETIDLHTSRVTVGLQYRLPGAVWVWLVGAAIATMLTVGYQAGVSAQKGFLLIHLFLATLFSSVVLLIADLDRIESTVRVSLQPMIELQKNLNEARGSVQP
jgi:hypothetical protein